MFLKKASFGGKQAKMAALVITYLHMCYLSIFWLLRDHHHYLNYLGIKQALAIKSEQNYRDAQKDFHIKLVDSLEVQSENKFFFRKKIDPKFEVIKN